uniref:NADH dehydrogenase subunit 4 n=1 Tax=Leptomastidea bifasciata TaxID=1880993 RepID=UPI002E77564C|nr:NADH dehydrogenase subunit 4 [Leptomastidea bifasciata]WPT46961.1 NADH dehydrogenase subunit 4 [Leptomastidea bifasciata]
MMKLINFLIMLNFLLYILKEKKGYFLSMMLMLMFFMLMLMINFNTYWMLIYSNLGLDNLSILMILLNVWIFILLMILNKNGSSMFYLILMSLNFILIMNFISMNFFFFYFFFESSLIPIYLLIMGWGGQPERLKASLYMLFYTLFFSLPLLYYLFKIYFCNKSLIYLFLLKNLFDKDYLSILLFLLMFMAFLVKLPVFFFHNWLPKAHVEAPVMGSMILASVMLKLGGYGIIRFFFLLKFSMMMFMNLFMVVSILGMMILSLLCLRHYDMKIIVAYSSVVHMGMMLVGLFSMSLWGILGGLFMMFSHGLCSSSMFYMVNLFYDRSKSRSLLINKGVVYFLPSLMIFWFLLCMNNMASPVSLNLLSEIMIISIILNWSMSIILLIMLGMYFSSCYNLYLFSYSFHGMFNNNLLKIFSINIKEYYILIFHFIPLNMLILKINLFI